MNSKCYKNRYENRYENLTNKGPQLWPSGCFCTRRKVTNCSPPSATQCLYRDRIDFLEGRVKFERGLSQTCTNPFEQKLRNQWLGQSWRSWTCSSDTGWKGSIVFFSELSIDWYDSSVPISLQINFCAASMMRSFSQASFDSNRCWSSFFRIYISLRSHGSSVTSSIISDCWRRFTLWIFCLCFQNARSIINQLCFALRLITKRRAKVFFQ